MGNRRTDAVCRLVDPTNGREAGEVAGFFEDVDCFVEQVADGIVTEGRDADPHTRLHEVVDDPCAGPRLASAGRALDRQERPVQVSDLTADLVKAATQVSVGWTGSGKEAWQVVGKDLTSDSGIRRSQHGLGNRCKGLEL